ncbi:hypothetical protein NGB58_24900 [Escherichia coli]|nr:hypothetical protein [Escherichia coli]
MKNLTVVGAGTLLAISVLMTNAYASGWMSAGNHIETTAIVENGSGLTLIATRTGEKFYPTIPEDRIVVAVKVQNNGSDVLLGDNFGIMIDNQYGDGGAGKYKLMKTDGSNDKISVVASGNDWNTSSNSAVMKYAEDLNKGLSTSDLNLSSDNDQTVSAGTYKIGMTGALWHE